MGLQKEVRMRKFGAIIGTVVIIGTAASAVNMSGKIGFGVGPYSGGSIWEPSVFSMRISPFGPIVIEPRVVYSSDVTDNKIDSTKVTTSNVGLAIRGLFPFLKKEKSNLYGTFGFGFDTPKTVYESYATDSTTTVIGYSTTTSGTTYDIFFGVAFEHFINSNFSVCISSESSYGGSSSKTEWKSDASPDPTITSNSSGTDLFFGNTKFGLMFFWYL